MTLKHHMTRMASKSTILFLQFLVHYLFNADSISWRMGNGAATFPDFRIFQRQFKMVKQILARCLCSKCSGFTRRPAAAGNAGYVSSNDGKSHNLAWHPSSAMSVYWLITIYLASLFHSLRLGRKSVWSMVMGRVEYF